MFTEPLSRRVARRGFAVLDALAAPHGVDRFVELAVPTWSTSEVRGRIVEVDRSIEGTVLLTVEANRGWTGSRAGQHTQLSVEIDGVRHTRCYSVATAEGASRRFQLGIKAHPHGRVSQHLVAHARPGTVVGLTPPAGDFHLPEQRPDRLLLISGGSGITPVLSMLRTLAAEGHRDPVTFVHYTRSPATMLCGDEIRELAASHPNVRLVTGFDDEPDAGDLVGLFAPEHLEVADPDWRHAETYVCGPAPLMDAVRHEFERAGIGHRVHTEAFTLDHLTAEGGTAGGTVRFAASDTEVDDDGRPLLLQAEDAGLRPASGCRMGICHTCTCTLRQGTVRNALTGAVTSGPGAEVQACVNVPVGSVEVEL